MPYLKVEENIILHLDLQIMVLACAIFGTQKNTHELNMHQSDQSIF